MTKYYKGKIAGKSLLPETGILESSSTEGTNLSPSRYFEHTECLMGLDVLEKERLKNIRRDMKIYSRGLEINRDIQKIFIGDLYESYYNWSPFGPMNPEMKKSIKYSIEKYGISSPAIVVKRGENNYMILDGRERAKIMSELYLETNSNKFKFFPCFVLEEDEVNDIVARDIIIESNLNKKCSKFENTKLILMKLGIEQNMKDRKKDLNLARKVASDMNYCESTIYNYATLSNCIIEYLHMLEVGQLNLGSVRKLSKYPEYVQKELVKQFGMSDFRNCFVEALPKKILLKSVKTLVDIFKSRKHPTKSKIKVSGYHSDMMKMYLLIKKIQREEEIRGMKVVLKDNEFNFSTGYKEIESFEEIAPNYFLDHIEDLE